MLCLKITGHIWYFIFITGSWTDQDSYKVDMDKEFATHWKVIYEEY